MILGIGTDIVSIERIAELRRRHADRFVRRILSEAEVSIMPGAGADAFLAGRFAAKEAFIKALGRGVPWTSVEVVNLPSGQPTLSVRDGKDYGFSRAHVSLTHLADHAIAVVVLER